jgi:hypothetical protein
MVIAIPIWYLDPPYMVLEPPLPHQAIALPMQTPVQSILPQPSHIVGRNNTNIGRKKKIVRGNAKAKP